ncbi:MAG: polysaccharide pyruvyl transferase family protein [Longibaculum sp.]
MKKIGIITFHRAYNCGSMMQCHALETVLKKSGYDVEIIDFSNQEQIDLYKTFFPNNTIKNIVKNIVLSKHKKRIEINNSRYDAFIAKNMTVSKTAYHDIKELSDSNYYAVVTGSDQVWNITIQDHDDAYFLPWVHNAKKIAYAPSFGARNPLMYSDNQDKYRNLINDFDYLSVRENNGKKWIEEISGRDAKVVLDPTLLLGKEHYKSLITNSVATPEKFIFYYSPHYTDEINELVSKISKKLDLPVIAFNSKAFYTKFMDKYGFTLPTYEDPSIYLELIDKAEMVITTSFHGTIFSSIFRKKFWVVKNAGMYESDDRVFTMTSMLDLNDRIITTSFDDSFDYNQTKNYRKYEELLTSCQNESMNFLLQALSNENEN